MEGVAFEKVPEGKLLRIKIEYDKKIKKVQITGDFFAYPEESIGRIEKFFKGKPADFDVVKLNNKLNKFVRRRKYELLGINPEAIVRVIKGAMK